MATQATAQAFLAKLQAPSSPVERDKLRRHFRAGEGGDRTAEVFLGVRMGDVVALAKEFIDLPPDELDQLLTSPIHEARAGGLHIMGKQPPASGRPSAAARSSTRGTGPRHPGRARAAPPDQSASTNGMELTIDPAPLRGPCRRSTQ